MSPQRKALVIVVAAIALLIGLVNALALTQPERKKVQLALEAVKVGLQQNMDLRYEAAQARTNTSTANSLAGEAWASAFSTGLKAKSALDEAARCQKENERMRPIVDAVTGPWWFPGGKALIYGAKKSILSLIVILAGGFVIFLIIKIVLTVVTGGTWSAGMGAVTGIFGSLFRWLGRVGKRLLSFTRKRGDEVVDTIRHRTIGTDDE